MQPFAIVKTQVATSSGGIATVWNVIDVRDGYIFDTFDTKREAKAWVDNARRFDNVYV
jgi:hypothetical protein